AAALGAGATSGFSGTSGPLKGIALRGLGLDRARLVGAASAVSLAGDATKAVVFLHASLLDSAHWPILLWALPLMPITALVGRRINRQIGERAYTTLFWLVIAGYSARLLAQ
ncbi:MAG: TSUP family transporter, partial [Gemmatimonadota bacterium]|nr:TSUP family transporter [Gemmatimonadota bacterium]